MRSSRKRSLGIILAFVAAVVLVATSCTPVPSARTWSYVGRSSDGSELIYRLNSGAPSTVCFQSRIDIRYGQRDGIIKVTGLRPGDQVRPQNTVDGWTGGVVFKRGTRIRNYLPPGNYLSSRVAFRDQTVQTSNNLCRFFGGPGDYIIRM